LRAETRYGPLSRNRKRAKISVAVFLLSLPWADALADSEPRGDASRKEITGRRWFCGSPRTSEGAGCRGTTPRHAEIGGVGNGGDRRWRDDPQETGPLSRSAAGVVFGAGLLQRCDQRPDRLAPPKPLQRLHADGQRGRFAVPAVAMHNVKSRLLDCRMQQHKPCFVRDCGPLAPSGPRSNGATVQRYRVSATSA